MIKRFLNVCTALTVIITIIVAFSSLSQKSTPMIEYFFNSLFGGLVVLAIIATLNYVIFSKITIFHKKGE